MPKDGAAFWTEWKAEYLRLSAEIEAWAKVHPAEYHATIAKLSAYANQTEGH